MVRAWFVLFAKIYRSVGVVNIRNCLLYWYGQFIIYSYLSITLYILYNIPRNICLEILINLRIYLVFMRISNCILWNPWISVVKFAIFNLKSFKNCHFITQFYLLSICFPCRIQFVRGVSLTSKFASLDLF